MPARLNFETCEQAMAHKREVDRLRVARFRNTNKERINERRRAKTAEYNALRRDAAARGQENQAPPVNEPHQGNQPQRPIPVGIERQREEENHIEPHHDDYDQGYDQGYDDYQDIDARGNEVQLHPEPPRQPEPAPSATSTLHIYFSMFSCYLFFRFYSYWVHVFMVKAFFLSNFPHAYKWQITEQNSYNQ